MRECERQSGGRLGRASVAGGPVGGAEGTPVFGVGVDGGRGEGSIAFTTLGLARRKDSRN